MTQKLIKLLLALVLSWLISGCQTKVAPLNHDQVREFNALWATLPLHASFREVKPPSFSPNVSLPFSGSYTSSASYQDIKQFYQAELASNGWQFIQDKAVKDRGRMRGERWLEFQKNSYVLVIKYAGERSGELGWMYKLDLGWIAN